MRSSRKAQEETQVINTDLFDAISQGDKDSVEALLGMQDDPMELLRKKDPQGLTPLRKAVALNKTEICRILIDFGAEASLVDPLGKTVLHRAASVGSRDLMAPLLVSPDSAVNSQDKKGNTPLHYAVKGSHHAAVDWLLFLGADVNRKNNDDKSPIDISPPDLIPILKRESRDMKVEPVELASSFVSQKYMAKLGSAGDVLLVTSDDWPRVKQFLLCVRKRAAYSLPPVPLRQDEAYFNDTVHYRLMYTLPVGKTRVKVYFSVFEELTESELVMKITSRDNFLGEVPVEMSTYIVNDYTNYIYCGDLDLKNQGTFVLVKRPKWIQLVKDDSDVYHNPQLEGFVLTFTNPLPTWPEDFKEQRMETEMKEKDKLMAPLLAALREKYKDTKDDEDKKTKTTDELDSAYRVSENTDNKNNSGVKKDKSNNRANQHSLTKKKSAAEANVLSKTSLPEEEEDAPPELLSGHEEDNCNDFYYMSRGWGLYVQTRQTIKSQILLDIFDPEEATGTWLRTNTVFYTLRHSSGDTQTDPFTLQFPKIPDNQNQPFFKVGTILVFVRRPLAEDEEEFPDPDESQEESFIAEDGKSTKLQFWLNKEKERWSLLPYGISNNQTRVVCAADLFSTYIVVQLNVGTDKWIYDDPDDETVSERSGDSDEDDEGEGGSGGEDEEADDEAKSSKKKNKKSNDTDASSTSESKKDSDKASSNNKSANNKSANNKSANKSANNKSGDNPKPSDKGKGALLTAEPGAPAPSPQPSITEFKDRSENKTDVESDETDSESSDSVCENDNNNSSKGKTDTNNSNENSVTKGQSQTKAKDRRSRKQMEAAEASKKSVVSTTDLTEDSTLSDPDFFANLEEEEITVNMGMRQARTSFYSLEPRPPPADEGDVELVVEESGEELPVIQGSKSMRFPRSAILEEYEFGLPLNTLSFEHEDFVDIEAVHKEVALMWRYRNHIPVSVCIFIRPRPHEELSWDLILELVSSVDLVVRAENWLAQGYCMISRTKEFPFKSNRQLLFTIVSNLIIAGPNGCQPGGTKTMNMWYVSNKVNFIELQVKKFVEPKLGFGGGKKAGGGGRKKDEPKIREPDLSLVVDAYYPGLISVKEMAAMTVFVDAERLWANEHKNMRVIHDSLLTKLVQYLKELPEVTQIWWKVWIMLGYPESDMEREKSNQDFPESTAKIMKQWFADNLDEMDSGILRVIHTLRCLKLPDEVITDFIALIKEYKGNYVLRKDTKPPRYHKLLFHWIKETKITANNIFSIIESPILPPTSDIFLLQLSQLISGTPEDLSSAMDVEENYLYMLNDDETISEPSYKPFKILTKARQKNEDIVKYFVLLLEMVKKTSQHRQVGDFAVSECHRWMESVAEQKDYKDTCTKLENLLSTYVPNKGASDELLAKAPDSSPKPKGSEHDDGHTATSTTEFTVTEDDESM